jgi:hypothetical protein
VSLSVCSRLGDLLARRDEDRLSASEERLLRGHVASCTACASEALRHDPTLLFSREAAADAPELLPAEARERFVGDVLAAVGAAKAERRFGAGHAGTRLKVAASLLLAASLVGVWVARDRGVGSPRDATPPVALAKEARSAPSEVLPAIEEIGGDGAVVYQFPATAPGEPTVVFVVDRNADI